MSKIKSDEELEAQIPAHAAKAAKAEYQKALDGGHAVTISDGKFMYRVFPDGTRKRIKAVAARVKVTRSKFKARMKVAPGSSRDVRSAKVKSA